MRLISYNLRILALIFWYLVAVFIVTLLVEFPGVVRGNEFRWDYEAMFSAIYLVWGIFLWKASNNIQEHKSFINFTVAANILHAIVMIAVGALRPGEFSHLLIDSFVLLLPSVSLLYLLSRNKNLV